MPLSSDGMEVTSGWYLEGGDRYCTLLHADASLNIALKNPKGKVRYDAINRTVNIQEGADALIDGRSRKTILENPIGTYTVSEINALIFPPGPSLIKGLYRKLSRGLSHIREKLKMIT